MNVAHCFVCSNPGHKSFRCPHRRLNKTNLVEVETLPTSSRSRSRSPVVRNSNDDGESTHSAGDRSLMENNYNAEPDFKKTVYIANFPKDWDPKKIKEFIIENVDQIRNKHLFVVNLKDKNFQPSGVISVKIDRKIANNVVESLANKMCEGKELLATLDADAPFLDNLLITKQSLIRVKEDLQWKKYSYNRNRQVPDSQSRENRFETNMNNEDDDVGDGNLYGLSRNFLDALGIKPPLRNAVFVANFDCEKVNQEKLREVFSLAGQVVSVYIFRNNDGTLKKCAKVTFDHPIESVQAISMFHDQTLYGQNLLVRMDNTRKNFMPALPDGVRKIGPGLGPKGQPLGNVRNTIEWEPLKHLLLKELSKLKADSVSNLEKSISQNSFFHQNVPIMPNYAMGGAEQMAVNPMTLNNVINQIAQNAAMNIMSQNPGINSMARNASMNSMAQNATFNSMTQNTAMNAMAQNAAMNPMMQNSAMNPMAQNVGMNPMAQNAGMNPMTQNADMNPMAQNVAMNPMAQNAAMNPMAQNAAMNPMAQNAAMNPMAQNAAMNPMAQNAAMNPMAQNVAMNTMQQNVDPNLMNPNHNMMGMNSMNNMMGMNSMNSQTQGDMQQPNMTANMQGYQQQGVTNVQNRDEWNLGTGYVGNSYVASQQSYHDTHVNQGNTSQREYNPLEVTESASHGASDMKTNTGDNRTHMLLFTNLPYSVNQESLTSKMREIGKLKFIELTGQGRAILSFEKYTDAERCINLFHRCKVDGQIIEVKFF